MNPISCVFLCCLALALCLGNVNCVVIFGVFFLGTFQVKKRSK